MKSSPSPSRIWLITGAGRGLGHAFARAALAHGDRVVGTVRRTGAMADLLTEFPGSVRGIVLDVRDAAAVAPAVEAAARAFGGLDVVVNNAGTGFVGALEEIEEQAARDHLDLNLFGALWVSRAAVPHLRPRRRRHRADLDRRSDRGDAIVRAVQRREVGARGIHRGALGEVAQFGIRTTIAQLGGFATDWAGSSMPFAAPRAEYDDLRTALFGAAEVPWPAADPDTSPTDADPAVAADALLAHLGDPDHPLRVLIGEDAPGHAALAYAARKESYGADGGLVWPT